MIASKFDDQTSEVLKTSEVFSLDSGHYLRRRDGLTVSLVLRVAFRFFEFFADFLARHLQRPLKAPALPDVVECGERQNGYCDASDETDRGSSKIRKLFVET